MMKGKIASINVIDKSGIILDENIQDVPFYFENLMEVFGISEEVEFEIKLTEKGLAAVKVKMQATMYMDS